MIVIPVLVQFCQPLGWELHTQRLPPTYIVSVLTDIDGNRHYCACLTFMEDVNSTTFVGDEMKEGGQCVTIPTPDGMAKHSCMFAPKSLVLVSQLDYFQTFRVHSFTIYIEHSHSITLLLTNRSLTFNVSELFGFNLHGLYRQSTDTAGNVDRKHIGLYPGPSPRLAIYSYLY